jgi:predicted site-specific integrase-resolvase
MDYGELRTAVLEGTIDPLTSAEVALLFRVNPRTVGTWKQQGKIEGFYTPGHRLRFKAEQFRTMITEGTSPGG